MHTIIRFVTPYIVCSAVAAFAQSSGKQDSKQDTADDAWLKVTTLATPITSAKTTTSVTPDKITSSPSLTNSSAKKTAAQIQTDRKQQANQFLQASQSAKDFYTNFPDHVKAGEAKKIEVLAALQGASSDDKAQGQSAIQLAQNYRGKSANAASDRFEVAVMAERLKLSVSSGGSLYENNPKELEKIADGLRREFGDMDEVHRFYASVARTADMDTAKRVAGELLQWPAPAEAKAEAQTILDRQNLVGQVLNAQWPTMDGKTFDLSQQTGKLTIVYVWSTAGDEQGMGGLLGLKKTLPANTQMVYLALGGAADQLQALKDSAPISGTYCFEAINTASPARELLKVRHTPFVFVLNKAGKLTGFGPVSELSNLVTAASH